MKYLLLIPVAGYYLMRDMAMLINHGDLVRGLALFVLTFLVLLLSAICLNVINELNKVKKQIGDSAYKWMVR